MEDTDVEEIAIEAINGWNHGRGDLELMDAVDKVRQSGVDVDPKAHPFAALLLQWSRTCSDMWLFLGVNLLEKAGRAT